MAFLDNNGLTRYDGKLKDLLARKTIISGVESTATASKAYAAGEYFVLNDVLYKVTAAIASGGTITPGTNCTATDVSAELGTLKDSIDNLGSDDIANDSSNVSGTSVTNAIDNLKDSIDNLGSDDIANDSSNVSGTSVTNAIDNLKDSLTGLRLYRGSDGGLCEYDTTE